MRTTLFLAFLVLCSAIVQAASIPDSYRPTPGAGQSESSPPQPNAGSDNAGASKGQPATIALAQNPSAHADQKSAETSPATGKQDDKAASDWWLVFWTAMLVTVTGLLVIVTGVQVGLFFWQLRLIRRSLKDTKTAAKAAGKAADAAKRSADVATIIESARLIEFFYEFSGIKQIVNDTSMYIITEMSEQGMSSPFSIKFTPIFHNVGKTVANVIAYRITSRISNVQPTLSGEYKIFINPIITSGNKSNAVPDMEHTAVIPRYQRVALANSSEKFWVIGEIYYSDIFDLTWRRSFSYWYDVPMHKILPASDNKTVRVEGVASGDLSSSTKKHQD
jgi:hypothetical protein